MSDLKNKLSHLIEGQIPDYLRDSYPLFATFIKKYYEFLEQSHEANYLLLNSNKWSDVDLTLDMFVEKMREQHAYDISPNALLERKRLIKFINQYYEAKGSENAAELFFRMMYNDNATVKYPGDYVLRPSDGKWIVKKTIKIDTDYLQINPVSVSLKPAPTAQSASLSLFDLKDKQIYLKYNVIDNDGLNTYSVPIICLTVAQIVNNSDIYELEIDLARGTSVADLNKLLSTLPYMETVWITALHEETEYTYGFLSQQLIGYNIIDGGENFRRRDTFEVEVSETLLFPIPGQEVNNGLVRVNSITGRDYEQFFAEDYAPLYGVDDVQGIINGLTFLNTGYRFDITGDYFAESYTEADDYTTYKTFERTLVNPRSSTDALVKFDVGYIYQRPGMWMDNSGFLSDINKLQDNYYYQAFSYVIQTTAIPYHKWESLYKLSAHPAGFKVFGELLVEHSINITPIDIESATFYTEMFIDGVFPIDEIVIDFYKVNVDDVHVWNSYAPYYFGEEYTFGDDVSWLLEKPIDNNVISDDADYNFEIGKNILGTTGIQSIDGIEKDINVLYTDIPDAEDEFDRVVDYVRDFDENEFAIDSVTNNYSKDIEDDNAIIDEFDRVVDYVRDFDETEIITESALKDVEKIVVENNGYNTQEYFSEEYAQIVGVVTTESVFSELTRLVDISDSIPIIDTYTVSADKLIQDDIIVFDGSNTILDKNIADSIVIADTVERNIQQNNDAQSDLSEDIGILDIQFVEIDTPKIETVIIGDINNNLTNKNITTDGFSVADSELYTYQKNITDIVNNNEILAKVTEKYLQEDTGIIDSSFITIQKDNFETLMIIDGSVINTEKSIVDNIVHNEINSKHINKVVDGAQFTAETYFSELYNYDTSENFVVVTDESSTIIGKNFSENISGITDSSIISLNHVISDEFITSEGIHYHHFQNDDELSDFADQNHALDTLNVTFTTSKTDSTSISDSSEKLVSRPVSDAVSSSDNITGKTLGKNTTETILTTENFVKNISYNITDTFNKTDTLNKNTTKILADNSTLSDNLTAIVFRLVVLVDTLSSTDSITKNISDNLADTFTKTDDIVKNFSNNKTDTIVSTDILTKVFSDSLTETVANSDSIVKNISDNLADTFTKSDDIVKHINSGTKVETISSADSNVKHIDKPIDGTYYNEQNYFAEEYIYDISQNLVDASDVMNLVNEGYAGSGYASDGYVTETRTI